MRNSSRKPLGLKLFNRHKKCEAAAHQLDRDNLVVFHGPSGSGKTEFALQLEKKYASDKDHHFVGWFRCDEPRNILTDIKQFARKKDLLLATTEENSTIANILRDLMSQLNERYPHVCKLLVFDDAEPSTQIMKHVDEIFLGYLKLQPCVSISKWKIVCTTQTSFEEWAAQCNLVSSNHFVKVSEFDTEEMKEFFNQSDIGRTLSSEKIEKIKDKVGSLPLVLQVLKSESSCEKSLMERIYTLGGTNDYIESLHNSLERLIKHSDHKDEYKELIILLTMFEAKNITFDLLTSCAEVTSSSCSIEFMLKLIKEMAHRYLCEAPEPFQPTSLLSFHKLIFRSMCMFRPSDDEAVKWIRKALIALTQVMPRDGRAHQSHVINDCMYDHAHALAAEVKRLRYDHSLDREETPCIMLLMSHLQMSMAYCRLANRGTDAEKHTKKALKWFTELVLNETYDRSTTNHVERAKELFSKVTDSSFILCGNQHFTNLVRHCTQFVRLTPRDVGILFGTDATPALCNGHLNENQIDELRAQSKVLSADDLQKFYAAELLAEIYSTGARALGLNSDPKLTAACLNYANAALEIYSMIKEKFGVALMAGVITERQMLKFRLRENEDPDDIANRYRVLQHSIGKAYEYGLLRADFSEDPYNHFLCAEGLAICAGRSCAAKRDDEEFDKLFDKVVERFQTLFAAAKTKEAKLHMNHQTSSKLYRNYGDFLRRVGKFGDAVKAVLEAFIHLNFFLNESEDMTLFPELDASCGKAQTLLKLLADCFKEYDESISADAACSLLTPETDEAKIAYLTQLVGEWRRRMKKPEAFGVMNRILIASPPVVVPGTPLGNPPVGL